MLIWQILWKFLPVTNVKFWPSEIDLPVTNEGGIYSKYPGNGCFAVLATLAQRNTNTILGEATLSTDAARSNNVRPEELGSSVLAFSGSKT